MRFLYFLRVLLISVDALIIGVSGFIWYYFLIDLNRLAMTILLNNELAKYLIILPIGIVVWILKEFQQLLQSDKSTTRFLVGWPDYWKLKLHIWVSVFYAVIFACLSIAPWVVQTGISTGTSLLFFITGIVGQLSLAISVYATRLRVKEILANAPEV
jgi:hypothetical protein